MTDQPTPEQIENDLDEVFAAAKLTRLLREAYMAGVESTSQGWSSELPGNIECLIEFEREAVKYATKIVGGRG
ncbi:hypothetical protein [Leisingera daeponensis]|uniref:hypothetical protein n=1 Tax=Leisingera daeponensis TaxID=405746 RepID=UPI0004855D7E|nr:hypothetical protein [Leisingera daeponensis]